MRAYCHSLDAVTQITEGGLRMASCKDCLHVDVCKNRDIFGDIPICEHFTGQNSISDREEAERALKERENNESLSMRQL